MWQAILNKIAKKIFKWPNTIQPYTRDSSDGFLSLKHQLTDLTYTSIALIILYFMHFYFSKWFYYIFKLKIVYT